MGKGRALLLEDDPSFREIIADCLTEAGFCVVAVQNGREGVQEVLGGDFALVLCDLSMPTMPGDMFYRAVERIRPRLCECFIFMTGYRSDASKSEFIKSINGYVLAKPFSLKDLQDSIAFAEVRRSFRSVFEEDDRMAVPARPDSYPASAVPLRAHPSGAGKPESLPLGPVDPAPCRPTILPASAPTTRVNLVSVGFALVGLALLAGLTVFLAGRYLSARDRAATASADRRVLDATWGMLSPQAKQAELARGGIVSLRQETRRILEEHKAGGWTGALRALSVAAGSEIDLRDITAHGIDGLPGACELRVEGVAMGLAPRTIADRFQQRLRGELEQSARGPVEVKFEKLEDDAEPSAAPAETRRASFALAVRCGAREPAKAERGATK